MDGGERHGGREIEGEWRETERAVEGDREGGREEERENERQRQRPREPDGRGGMGGRQIKKERELEEE